MSKLLFDENPLVILPELARKIGLNQAVVLQQLHYWLGKSDNIHEGKYWVYNTAEEWNEQFNFWSINTIRRAFSKLKEDGYISVKQLSKDKRDKTNFYTINYDLLDDDNVSKCINPKCTDASTQNGYMEEPKMGKCISKTMLHTETTTETTTENSAATKVATHLLNKILSYKPNFKRPTNLKAWSDDIDKAMRLDGRTEEELMNCIDWIYSGSDNFWEGNIMSGRKLREKFDKMESQMMKTRRKKRFTEVASENGTSAREQFNKMIQEQQGVSA